VGGRQWSRLDVVGGGARWPVTWPSCVGMRAGASGELVEMAATCGLAFGCERRWRWLVMG
jgi:hypothetical protein